MKSDGGTAIKKRDLPKRRVSFFYGHEVQEGIHSPATEGRNIQ
jgi:hypothetical protein